MNPFLVYDHKLRHLYKIIKGYNQNSFHCQGKITLVKQLKTTL